MPHSNHSLRPTRLWLLRSLTGFIRSMSKRESIGQCNWSTGDGHSLYARHSPLFLLPLSLLKGSRFSNNKKKRVLCFPWDLSTNVNLSLALFSPLIPPSPVLAAPTTVTHPSVFYHYIVYDVTLCHIGTLQLNTGSRQLVH